MSTAEVLVHISAEASKYHAGIASARRKTSELTNHIRSETQKIRGFMSSMTGQLSMLGMGFGVGTVVSESLKFEKQMRLMEIATGSNRAEMEAWRADLTRNQTATGTSRQKQLEFSKSLQAGGFELKAIRAATSAASATMAIAETDATALGKAIAVATEHFHIDKNDSSAITELLDKMTVAGILGNAELENLPDIFARVGNNAKMANMSLDQTLAYIETMSTVEANPERLATLVDSSLRVFTNAKYMKQAQKGTGVKFFDDQGSRRDPLKVIEDIRKGMSGLKTEAEVFNYLSKAFQTMDSETIKGIQSMLASGKLEELAQKLDRIKSAKGFTTGAMDTALDNTIAQAGRLGAVLRDSAENFIRPMDDWLSRGISYLLDPTQPQAVEPIQRQENEDINDFNLRRQNAEDKANKTGLGLSGNQLIAGGAGLAATLYALKFLGGKVGGKIMGKIGGMAGGVTDTAQGVLTGKALQQAAGIQPVYVVNMPDAGFKKDSISDAVDSVSGVATAGKFGKFAKLGKFAKAAGWIGTAVSVGADVMTLTDDKASAKDKAGAIGGLSGTVIGAAIGTAILPGIGTMIGSLVGGVGGEWLAQKVHPNYSSTQAASSTPNTTISSSSDLKGSSVQWQAYFAHGAKQLSTAMNTSTTFATTQWQAVGNALVAQINSTQIKGNIAVTVSPSSELLNVRATAIPGNANTQMTANVGRTGGPAS